MTTRVLIRSMIPDRKSLNVWMEYFVAGSWVRRAQADHNLIGQERIRDVIATGTTPIRVVVEEGP
jgi:hypothetical protein